MTFKRRDILQRLLKLSNTRAKEEEYDQFIEQEKRNTLAVKIKIADLEDNLDFGRIKERDENDLRRYEKYSRALATCRRAQPVNVCG